MDQINNRISDFFAKQGISVKYNCLGDSYTLARSYIKESRTIFLDRKVKSSNHIKTDVYNKFYTLPHREKKTGFELLSDKEKKFRDKHTFSQLADQWDYPNERIELTKNDGESYIENLKNSIRKIENPLIFYSGGIDSELLLTTFLDCGIKHKVVIFEFYDNKDILVNDYDIQQAQKFCKKNGIIPIVKKLNIDSLWDKTEFIEIAKKIKIQSPQQLTHVYMIYIMAEEYPGFTYCFAGEVRYTNNIAAPESNTVMLQSSKQSFYIGYWFTDSYLGSIGYPGYLRLTFTTSGVWVIYDGFGERLVSGIWTDTPARTYYGYLSGAVLSTSPLNEAGGGQYSIPTQNVFLSTFYNVVQVRANFYPPSDNIYTASGTWAIYSANQVNNVSSSYYLSAKTYNFS